MKLSGFCINGELIKRMNGSGERFLILFLLLFGFSLQIICMHPNEKMMGFLNIDFFPYSLEHLPQKA